MRDERKGKKKNNCSITKTKAPKKALNSSAFHIAHIMQSRSLLLKKSALAVGKNARHETWSEMHKKFAEHVLSPRLQKT